MDTNITPPAGPQPEPPRDQPSAGAGPQAQGTQARGTQADGRQGPRVAWDDVKDVRRLRRSRSERMVSGVSGGLARHLDVDPLLVRVGFGVLALLGGAGVLLYAGMWLLVPEDGEEQGVVSLDARNRQFALWGVAAVAVLCLVGGWDAEDVVWPLIVVVALLGWLLHDGRKGARQKDVQEADARVAAYGAAAPGPVSLGKDGPRTWAEPTTYPPTMYAAPTYAAPTYEAPAPVRTPDPRRRGPILFWIMAAIAALAVGLLGMVDLSGVDVPASAYPATVTGAAALGLLVGAFWGRAGGLIALGLVAAAATASVASVEQFPRTDLRVAPVSAAALGDVHEFRAGEFVLDLTEVEDVDALAGRELTLAGGVGRIEVWLPAGTRFDLYAEVGVGSLDMDGELQEGLGLSSGMAGGPDDGAPLPPLMIDVELGVGDVVVQHSPWPDPASSGETADDSILLEGNPS